MRNRRPLYVWKRSLRRLDEATRCRAVRAGMRPRQNRIPAGHVPGNRERMVGGLQIRWHRGAGHDGRETRDIFVRDQAGSGQGGRGRGDDQARSHGKVRDNLHHLPQDLAKGVREGGPDALRPKPKGRHRGTSPPAQEDDTRTGARATDPEAGSGERLIKKNR